MANVRMYILDERREPVPIGVSGEIYIGGAGVARGYLNQAELTAERFIKDPFSADPQGRMYRTGDVGRYRVDGTIEYLGRNDEQVKIRGYRIELGEIEAALLRHEAVKQAVVLAREDVPGEKRLVGYVVLQREAAASMEELRGHLQESLPEYMVPAAFVMLESLPLTANGKVDRRALPAPDLSALRAREYEAPQGEIETTLADIWRQLLGVERVGRHDSFFELGGHSLMATRALVYMRQALKVDIPLSIIFSSPTILAIAESIFRKKVSEYESEDVNRIVRDLESLSDDELQEAVSSSNRIAAAVSQN
jgi:hypothetical protein